MHDLQALACAALLLLPGLWFAAHRICDAVRTARWDAGHRVR